MQRRDHVLTVRLCGTELALINTIRQGCCVVASQADVITWALEDMCARIATDPDYNIALREGAREQCAHVLKQLRDDRHCTFQGRPPHIPHRDPSAAPAPARRQSSPRSSTDTSRTQP